MNGLPDSLDVFPTSGGTNGGPKVLSNDLGVPLSHCVELLSPHDHSLELWT